MIRYIEKKSTHNKLPINIWLLINAYYIYTGDWENKSISTLSCDTKNQNQSNAVAVAHIETLHEYGFLLNQHVLEGLYVRHRSKFRSPWFISITSFQTVLVIVAE